MPLDGHSYLVSQGWSGTGKGLRENSLSRPIAIPQKRNLRGLGKDRDEAFPFWDHLFSAASTAIQIKIADSDASDDEAGDEPTNLEKAPLILNRTVTGIISNRNPIASTPASTSTSGTSTPLTTSNDESSTVQTEQLNQSYKYTILAQAKRQAAKQRLYASFFRGLVLGPDTDETVSEVPAKSSIKSLSHENQTKKRALGEIELTETIQEKPEKTKKKRKVEDEDEADKKSKSKKAKRAKANDNEGSRHEKRSKDPGEKERRKAEKAERRLRKEEKRARKQAALIPDASSTPTLPTDNEPPTHALDQESKKEAKARRKAERAAKKRLKQGGEEVVVK